MSITKTLATIMGTKESVAALLMEKYKGSLIDLMNADKREYINVMGIGKVGSERLDNALQLHTYINGEVITNKKKISDALDVWNLLKDSMRTMQTEKFTVLILGGRNELLKTADIAIGKRDSCIVHSSDVFREALLEKACAVILVHNHPSGDPSPSPEDCAMTRKVVSGGALLGISVLDHIIIGKDGYCSLREEGLIG